MSRRGRRVFRPRRWALLLLVVAALAVASDLFLPAGAFPPRERRVVLVQRGQTLREIGEELQRVGVLRGTLGFQVLARLMHVDRGIKAGQYSFRLGITVPALLRAFARGMSGLNLVTIPEGLTVREVSALLARHLGAAPASFDSLARDRVFLDSLGIAAPSLEGYLAPDTYEFLPGTPPEVALRTMAARQQSLLREVTAGIDSLPLGMSLHQVLTLASIVESEAQVDPERARIARVYINRLERHMLLQADPTVAYALGMNPRSRLYLRQLRTPSPFNTYRVAGLPPGPICNPGRKSIEAAARPSSGGREPVLRRARRRTPLLLRHLRAAPRQHRPGARAQGRRHRRRCARRGRHARERRAAAAARTRAGAPARGRPPAVSRRPMKRARHAAPARSAAAPRGPRGARAPAWLWVALLLVPTSCSCASGALAQLDHVRRKLSPAGGRGDRDPRRLPRLGGATAARARAVRPARARGGRPAAGGLRARDALRVRGRRVVHAPERGSLPP